MSAEVADVIRYCLPNLFITNHIRKVLTNLLNCRTGILGVHQYLYCDNPDCDYAIELFNSCRDRHCPKCQGSKKLKWISKQLNDVLPINYFHVVFTLPSTLRKLFKYNKKICYSMLFKAVSYTLNTVSATNKKLKAKIGFIAILHTWTQLLHFHPHIHCIISGGGISLEGTKWKSCSENYFLPQKVLCLVFRGKLLNLIEEANKKGLLKYPKTEEKPNKEYLNNLQATLKKASRLNWVIYTKKAFGGPTGVINYLGNYTHRIALSDSRIKSFKNGIVKFSWKDRKHGNITKTETLKAMDFMQRYIFHILPSRFVKIRYYGFLASAKRKENLKLCRKLIDKSGIKKQEINKKVKEGLDEQIRLLAEPKSCPCCKKGLLLDLADIVQNDVSQQETRAG
jgi:hypothetical protein